MVLFHSYWFRFSIATNAGVKVIDDISAHNSGGVQAINVTGWVNHAVAWVKSTRKPSRSRSLTAGRRMVLGPGGRIQRDAAAYASLLKAVHEAFVANFGSGAPADPGLLRRRSQQRGFVGEKVGT